ncbi:MAG: hypothetical protein GX032_01275 [Tenericutes bacterium]|nr:hypothetical protein [Mycoplasmatota bacterium]
MTYSRNDIDFDRTLHVLNNDYNSFNDSLNLMVQNLFGFAVAATIQVFRDKINSDYEFTQALLKSSFWFLLIDNIIINRRRNQFKKDKIEAYKKIKEIAYSLNLIGINVTESDLTKAVKEKIDKNMDYYKVIDMFNNIALISLKRENKDILFGEGIDEYDKVELNEVGSVAIKKDHKLEIIPSNKIIDRNNYLDVKTYYELEYAQDKDEGKITYWKSDECLKIIRTEGKVSKLNKKDKYLKLGLILQSIDYKDSYEINKIVKEKIL